MKIKLDDLEVIALQEIRRNKRPSFNISELVECGLVRDNVLTPLGHKVLNMHEPVTNFYPLRVPQYVLQEYYASIQKSKK